MTQPPDLEPRVAALEARVSELDQQVRRSQQDAAAARVLAGGADRDVTEMRAEIREFRDHNIRLLNAMREDLSDLRSRFDAGFAEMTGRLGNIDGRLGAADTGFIAIRGRLDAAAAGQEQIVALLNTLISRDGDE